jgi:hypothetical protein
MAGIQDKSPSEFWQDIIHADNSNTGFDDDGHPKKVKDGNGVASALMVNQNRLHVQPANDDKTDVLKVFTVGGTAIFNADTTNEIVRAGTTQTAVNTQYAEFVITNITGVSGTIHANIFQCFAGHID